jgi:hypothetical protein
MKKKIPLLNKNELRSTINISIELEDSTMEGGLDMNNGGIKLDLARNHYSTK